MDQIWKPLDQQEHVEGKNGKFTDKTKDCFPITHFPVICLHLKPN